MSMRALEKIFYILPIVSHLPLCLRLASPEAHSSHNDGQMRMPVNLQHTFETQTSSANGATSTGGRQQVLTYAG